MTNPKSTVEMKEKKIIRYRLGISRFFPSTHPKRGFYTEFPDLIQLGIDKDIKFNTRKIHTIRANYELWKKRFEKIDRGEAVLELFHWSGKPYNSKQVVFATLGKNDGLGMQRIDFPFPNLHCFLIDGTKHQDMNLSKNDGLSYEDFRAWFKGYDLSKPMAIIHFTQFRY